MPRGKQNTPSGDNGKERPQVGKRTTWSRKGAASHQSEDEQHETPMETEDAELHPLLKKQASRKAKTNTSNSKKQVKTGHHKIPENVSKDNDEEVGVDALEDASKKTRQKKGQHKGAQVEAVNEEPAAAVFRPVAVEPDDDSTTESKDSAEGQIEVPVPENLTKRKRADSQHNNPGRNTETPEPTLDVEVQVNVQPRARVKNPKHQHSVPSSPDIHHRSSPAQRSISPSPQTDSNHYSIISESTTGRKESSQRRGTSSAHKNPKPDTLKDLDELSSSDPEPELAVPKPPTKRARRALQNAALEKPELIDNDDNNDKPKTRGPTGKKNPTATGRKPKLASADTLFDQIWKSANKELKCFVYFVNPFPNSEDYDLLPQRVYRAVTHRVGQSGYRYTENVDSRAREAYSPEWSSSLLHRLSVLRASLKTVTVTGTNAALIKLTHDRRMHLLDDDEYWYKLDSNGNAVKNAPFLNPILQVILREGLFKGRAGLYNVFPDEFRGSGDKREMPAILITLAATFLHMALNAWVNHSGAAWDYNSSSTAEVYRDHLNELKRIEAGNPRAYLAILRKFFSNCMMDAPGAATHTRKKTKTDNANLPDTFSD